MAKEVLIVGAGVIGASAAYHLQKSGAQVTVVDAGLSGATATSFGWINASFYENTDYFHTRVEGIEAYRELAQELALPINWCGCLCWEAEGEAFDTHRDALSQLGYKVDEVDAAHFAKLEPHVADPPKRCLMFPREAAVESEIMTNQLLQAAIENGARLVSGVSVLGFEVDGCGVTGIRSDVGSMAADHVLVAAGTATQGLMESLQINMPMLKRPALMLKTRPVQPILRHILASRIGEVRQLPCGALLMPAALGHQGDKTEDLAAAPNEVADEALIRLKALLPNIDLEWGQAAVAYRPVPKDGMPVVGPVMEGLYIATMHSGITLAALMGRLIATEMLEGESQKSMTRLAPYRPSRFVN